MVQPLIAPLYGGQERSRVASQLLSGQSGRHGIRPGSRLLAEATSGADFETFWRKSLHDGWIEGTAFAPKSSYGEDLLARERNRSG